MASRSTAFLYAALLISGSVIACTETVIEQHIVPGPTDDAGPAEPVPHEPVPDAGEPDTAVPFVYKDAPAGTFAQAISAGGSVVKAPKIVSIIFTNDPQKDVINQFTTKLATSTYWADISAEYGVGPLTAKAPIILTEAPPTQIDNDQIETWLAGKFSSDPTRFGVPDSSTLYAIYYPAQTKITMGGGAGCTDFGGYHFETNVGAKTIAYAVMPRCAAFAGLGGADVTTFAASHEALEWATDPFPASSPAYMDVDPDHAVWSRVFLGELGDLCTQLGDVAIVPPDLGVTVQRTWSNASAKAGHHPCAPIGKLPYFTAFPKKLDAISVTDQFGRRGTTRGVKVGVGQSKTIDLTMYSDAAVGSWTVQIIDLTKIYGQTEEFSYALDKTKGTSGDTLQLTITGVRAAGQGQGFLIISKTAKDSNIWPVWVTN